MFWISCILGLIFLTPIGWIGMICLGAGVGIIVEKHNNARQLLITRLKWKMDHDSNESLREFIDEL